MKRACKRLVKLDHSVVGKDDVKKAMLEAHVAKNEFIRVGGFRFQPHTVGAWTTSSWSRTRVGRGKSWVSRLQTGRSRHTAFLRSRRLQPKSAPLPERYQAGDLVCYRISRDEHSGVST